MVTITFYQAPDLTRSYVYGDILVSLDNDKSNLLCADKAASHNFFPIIASRLVNNMVLSRTGQDFKCIIFQLVEKQFLSLMFPFYSN
jgi:hypothetical protein